MKKPIFPMIILLVVMLVGCTTLNVQMTPQRAYYESQEFFLNAWNSYHRVWLALPDTDPIKNEWAVKYHPKFLKAAELLSVWSKFPSGSAPDNMTEALNAVEDILIKLAISKGGK